VEKLSGGQLREILEQCGFSFSKSLGQNFLTDLRILNKIAEDAAIHKDACVLEVGPGAGTLTRVLAERAQKVVAVEIDASLLPVLEQTLKGIENITVLNADILKLDLEKLYQEHLQSGFLLVANLPYYITTPIIMKLLESGLPFASATVLVQREVAQRMAARPNTPEYGALSCMVQYYTKPVLCSRIAPNCFYPAPKVESQVVRLERLAQPPVKVKNQETLFKLIHSAFAMRRKTLANNIIAAFNLDRVQAEDIILKANIDVRIRGEALSLEQFAQLANLIDE